MIKNLSKEKIISLLPQILVVAVSITYIVAPDVIPGPVDDIIVALINAGLVKKPFKLLNKLVDK